MGIRASVQGHMKGLCSSASCLWWWPTTDARGAVWGSTSIQGGIFSLNSGNSPAFSNLWLWDILRAWYQWHVRKGDILEAHRCNSSTSSHHWSAYPFLLLLATLLFFLKSGWHALRSSSLFFPNFWISFCLEQSWQVALTHCMLGIHSVLQSLSSSSREIEYLKADHLPQQSLCKKVQIHNICT